jgi:CubicO group peptidase (beta-lactamase class C family)
MIRAASLLFCLALSTSAATGEPVVVNGPIGKKLDALLSRYAQYGLSATVLVAKDRRIVLHKGYGLADRERRIANSPDTLFEMGSLTKTLTAAALLRLEMDGKLRTADRVSKYLGEFPEPKAAVTLDHLLMHKGGLQVEGSDLGIDGNDRDAFVEAMKATPRESPPGERYRYTNAGYSVLAAAVERVTGQPFEAYVRKTLLAPAGMTNSGFRGDFKPGDRRMAKGYLGTPERIEEGPPPPYPWGTRGAGGLIATVGDIYRWTLALQGDAILSESARRKMFAPAETEQYGWHVETTERGTPLIQKGGGQVNFATHIMQFPAEGVVIVFASNNLQQRWRRTLTTNLPRAAMGETVLLPPPTIPFDKKSMERYLGAYGEVSIQAAGGALYLVTKSESLPTTIRFFPTAPSTFHGIDTAKNQLVSLTFEGTSAVIRSGNERHTLVRGADPAK